MKMMTSARPKRVPGQQRVIVQAMLMPGFVGPLEKLMASASPDRGTLSKARLSYIPPRSNRNLFNAGSFGTFYAAFRNPIEASMRKMFLAVMSAAALGGLVMTAASAMPVAPALPTASNVDQVRWACNEWGRCWWSRDYDPSYRYYRDNDDDWRWRRYRYGYGYYGWPHDRGWHGGWHRRWNDDD